jgi:surfeit locus 1 family protein
MAAPLHSRWLAVAGAALMAAICLGLGSWQLGRLREKEAWIAEMSARLEREPVRLETALTDPARHEFRRVGASGRFDLERSVLLVQRVRDGRAGVHVVTPLRLAGDERALLVDRGFVPQAGAEDFLASDDESGRMEVAGVLRPLAARELPVGRHEPRLRWYRVDLAGLQRQLPYRLVPALLVRGETPGRALPEAGFAAPRSRVDHLHYAITWYSIAAVACAIAAWIAWRGLGARPEAAESI